MAPMSVPVGVEAVDPEFPKGLRVILVDADSSSAQRTEAHLKECQYNVTKCYSVTAAKKYLRQFFFDALVVDEKLVINKNNSSKPELLKVAGATPVILIGSSIESEKSRQEANAKVMRSIQLGVCDYLHKPLCYQSVWKIWQHCVRQKMRKAQGEQLRITPDGEVSPRSPSSIQLQTNFPASATPEPPSSANVYGVPGVSSNGASSERPSQAVSHQQPHKPIKQEAREDAQQQHCHELQKAVSMSSCSETLPLFPYDDTVEATPPDELLCVKAEDQPTRPVSLESLGSGTSWALGFVAGDLRSEEDPPFVQTSDEGYGNDKNLGVSHEEENRAKHHEGESPRLASGEVSSVAPPGLSFLHSPSAEKLMAV